MDKLEKLPIEDILTITSIGGGAFYKVLFSSGEEIFITGATLPKLRDLLNIFWENKQGGIGRLQAERA